MSAFLAGASDVCVSGQAGRTRAHRLVVDAVADGLAPAGKAVDATDGGAFLKAARVGVRAV
jgi:hypothetical protein